MEISIVIPCLDEAETIPRLVPTVEVAREALLGAGHGVEVIVVDDGSRDGSWARLKDAAVGRPWLRLLRLRRTSGQTAAMAAGFAAAKGDVIVPMDADLQNDPADIPALLAKLAEGFDVVSGWRRGRKDAWLSRRVPSWIANRLIARVSGVRLRDFGCTLKAYRRTFIDGVALYGEMHRLLPVYAHWQGARVTEMPVTHHPRRAGRSHYGLGRTLRVLLDLVAVKFLGDFSTKPLYFFGGWGVLLCGAGTAAALVTLVEKYLTAEAVWVHRNPLFNVAVFLFMLGVQFIMLGLIAELQIRAYHEARGRPTYLIAEEVTGTPAAGGDEATAGTPAARR